MTNSQHTEDAVPPEIEKTLFQGLSQAEAKRLLAKHGPNQLEGTKKYPLLGSLWHIVREPMFLLLTIACVLYFFLGELTEALMMVVAIVFVAGIEIFQETKSERALEALRRYTEAKVRVLRDQRWTEIDSKMLVPGDIVALAEGERIPADGVVLQQNDLRVDESVLTGESMSVDKTALDDKKTAKEKSTTKPAEAQKGRQSEPFQLFQGTTVGGGKGIMQVRATGGTTEFGKLGKSIESIEKTDTPLQRQITRFVRFMGLFGAAAFLLVFGLNLWQTSDFWQAVIFSLTIAMALIPQEIPVAFSSFMGLGAYRMIKYHILAKQPKTVESLGSATVICLDKTGTITENRMSVAEVYEFSDEQRTLEYAFWASEEDPFDAMEIALEESWAQGGIQAEGAKEKKHRSVPKSKELRQGWKLVWEYALSGKPPMMTHVWKNKDGAQIVACKGAVERIIHICRLNATERKKIQAAADEMAAKGYRVLGVAHADFSGEHFPKEQDDFKWQMGGLVGFYDPPKPGVKRVFDAFYKAGIRVMMITGDHPETAKNIARSTGLQGWETVMTGDNVMELDKKALGKAVQEVHVFARMFPDAKLRVVEALQAQGETVAMSGDGVNDGPALKAAQIGVAMGKKGSDIAKSAASLVLLTDDLYSMVTAVKMGRRIYSNLRKAIRYVISIHVSIIALVLLPLLLGWTYPHILLPLHVIFLELVMDPTAAIAFENEPSEPHSMSRPPRRGDAPLFTGKELTISLLQGSVIALVVLLMYQYSLRGAHTEELLRSVVFATLVSSNIFLTLATRSYDYPFWRTLGYKNRIMPLILGISLLMLVAIIYVPPIAKLFKMAALPATTFALCMVAGLVSVLWFELYKWMRTMRS